MKFGICIGHKFEDGKFFIPHFDFLKKCGFEYFELNLGNIAKLSNDEFELFLKFIENEKINCEVGSGFIPANIRITGEGFDKTTFCNFVDFAVSRAKKLGMRKIVLGSGGARNIEPAFSHEKAREQLEFCIEYASQICAENEIVILLEHLNRMESNILTNFKACAKIMKNLNSKYKKCVIDFYHFNVGNENHQNIIDYKEQIAHVHYAYPVQRMFPLPLRFDEMQEDIKYIREIGYNDTFSIECNPMHLNSENPLYIESMKMIKSYFNAE